MKYQIHYLDEVDSTNIRAKELARQGAPEGTVVVADSQTAGRGRRGRSWVSPPGTSVYMSLVLRPQINPEQASMLTLVMGLSVAQVCRSLGLDAWIKWPNDVIINKKKVCGILTEMDVFPNQFPCVIMGTGVNVNQKIFPDEIALTATSLALEKEESIDRKALTKAILAAFDGNYQRFLQDGDLQSLMKEYNELLVNKEREVRILEPTGEYGGISGGINEKGELLVTREDGTCVAVYAGEVSVRGVYGYV